MDLTTKYMGLKLRNPLVASASPIAHSLDACRRMEDRGISAIVCFSLFEEQIIQESLSLENHLTRGTESYAESLSYFPKPEFFLVGPEEYLAHIAKMKKAVGIPVIGSLNGCSMGGWTKYAQHIQDAGADAIELNIYLIPADLDQAGEEIEKVYLDIIESVKKSVRIPVAVKLGPYFNNMANVAKRVDEAGADALVLFNRFYQPDIDLENLEVKPSLHLSTPQAMRLPMRWIALLYGRLKCSLAATGGVHTAQDALKMIMAGADVTMLCSVLFKDGVDSTATILKDMQEWMQNNEYVSIAQMQGSMSQKSCSDPEAFERANYMKVLQSYSSRVI
ncbi:MAG: dihydroorotate dehydrogenase-like protein [Candidatus Omnitrophica bacterium]|nr:dihydroorotate dehydrogenase-like protein [Candidatus Omnitrophota bacterium]